MAFIEEKVDDFQSNDRASLESDTNSENGTDNTKRQTTNSGVLVPVTSHRSQRSASQRRSIIDGSGHCYSNSENPNQERGPQDIEAISDEKAFEVGYEGEDDPMNPKNMKPWRKWSVVIILAFGALCVTCTSSLYTITYDQMDAEFGNSRLVATLGLALFVFGLGLSPMLLGPLSEFYGRRIIYIGAYVFFTVWLIPCAVAQNIQTMLIARFLDGFSGSAFLSVAGGTVGDMFDRDSLQAPMMIYTASPFIGPGLGPILGGFINYNVSWRWSYYTLLIWSATMLVLITLFVPETYMPVVLRMKAQKKRSETGDDRWKAPIEIHEKSLFWTVVRSLYRPFLLLFTEPMCFNLCLLSSIILGILYLFFGAFNLVFTEVYKFNVWQIGCSFLGLLIGMLLAIASDPLWHRNYLRLMKKQEQKLGERKSEPEFRLPPSIFGPWFAVIG